MNQSCIALLVDVKYSDHCNTIYVSMIYDLHLDDLRFTSQRFTIDISSI